MTACSTSRATVLAFSVLVVDILRGIWGFLGDWLEELCPARVVVEICGLLWFGEKR